MTHPITVPLTTTSSTRRQRAAVVVASALLLLGAAPSLHAQTDSAPPHWAATTSPTTVVPSAAAVIAAVPFAVGEELTYKATFGGVRAGTARMRVDGIEVVRGRPAYHVIFSVDGGVPFFRVHDRYESWIDVRSLASLRHRQQVSEGRYRRTTTYEIYPEEAQYQKEGDAFMRPSVSNPLDDGSFIYAVRVAGVRVGETRRDERYFRPDRNPVVLTGLRHDTVTVDAGTYATTVVRPTIKTTGMFAEDGDAQVWFTNDARRYPVLVRSHFAKFSLTLALTSVKAGAETSARGRRGRIKTSRRFN
ncbi:MAG TPA: DUF3108 domain-containing protein [Gemmatimonadaceae bacterium]|nr:DUF3108 domain-containing protein [Gemmatimonadaceae bacterium]